MSWDTHKHGITADEVDSITTDVELGAEEAEQLAQAKAAAAAIIGSGALGDTDGPFNVSFSGHAAPDHEPAGGRVSGIGVSILRTPAEHVVS